MIHHAELPGRVLETQSFLIHMTLTVGQSWTLLPCPTDKVRATDFTARWNYNPPKSDHFSDYSIAASGKSLWSTHFSSAVINQGARSLQSRWRHTGDAFLKYRATLVNTACFHYTYYQWTWLKEIDLTSTSLVGFNKKLWSVKLRLFSRRNRSSVKGPALYQQCAVNEPN